MSLFHTHPTLFDALEDNLWPLAELINPSPDVTILEALLGHFKDDEGDSDAEQHLGESPSASFSYGFLLAISQCLGVSLEKTLLALIEGLEEANHSRSITS